MIPLDWFMVAKKTILLEEKWDRILSCNSVSINIFPLKEFYLKHISIYYLVVGNNEKKANVLQSQQTTLSSLKFNYLSIY